MEKEVTRIDKNRKEITKNISHILQFICSARFTASSSPDLANNLLEGIHKLNVNKDTMIKNVRFVELDTSFPNVFLNIQTLKMI